MRWPLRRISPLVGPKRPLMRLKSVDLPAPFGPMMATRSPGATARSQPRMISVLPNDLRSPLSSMAQGAAHAGSLNVMSPRSRPGPRPSCGEATAAVLEGEEADHGHGQRRRASSRRCALSSVRPRKRSVDLAAGVELQAIHHLDQRGEAGEHHERRRREQRVPAPEPMQLRVRGDAQIHHHQAGDAARRVHHHEQEDEAEVELPRLRDLGEQARSRRTISTAPMIGPKKKVAPPRKVNSR